MSDLLTANINITITSINISITITSTNSVSDCCLMAHGKFSAISWSDFYETMKMSALY
jgi:hypothetical protein